ncbi:MAG: hypothetical protein IT569_01465 [Leptospiraceae bacterium]|nr:hypothetical protein [Leptospiraceae bacterium]
MQNSSEFKSFSPQSIPIGKTSSLLLFFLLLSFAIFNPIYSQSSVSETDSKTYIEENRKKVEKLKAKKSEEKNIDINSKENVRKTVDESVNFPEPTPESFLSLGLTVGSPASINFQASYLYRRAVIRGAGMFFNRHWNGGQLDLGYVFYKTPAVIQSFSIVAGSYNANPFNPTPGQGGQVSYDLQYYPGYNHNPPTYQDYLIRDQVKSMNPDLATYLDYQYNQGKKAYLHQSYIGITYDVRLGGFFLQLGIGAGKGDYRNPQLLFQLGYMFDFGRNKE